MSVTAYQNTDKTSRESWAYILIKYCCSFFKHYLAAIYGYGLLQQMIRGS